MFLNSVYLIALSSFIARFGGLCCNQFECSAPCLSSDKGFVVLYFLYFVLVSVVFVCLFLKYVLYSYPFACEDFLRNIVV